MSEMDLAQTLLYTLCVLLGYGIARWKFWNLKTARDFKTDKWKNEFEHLLAQIKILAKSRKNSNSGRSQGFPRTNEFLNAIIKECDDNPDAIADRTFFSIIFEVYALAALDILNDGHYEDSTKSTGDIDVEHDTNNNPKANS